VKTIISGKTSLMKDTETDAIKELEAALLDSGYSLKVKQAILDWYSRN